MTSSSAAHADTTKHAPHVIPKSTDRIMIAPLRKKISRRATQRASTQSLLNPLHERNRACARLPAIAHFVRCNRKAGRVGRAGNGLCEHQADIAAVELPRAVEARITLLAGEGAVCRIVELRLYAARIRRHGRIAVT